MTPVLELNPEQRKTAERLHEELQMVDDAIKKFDIGEAKQAHEELGQKLIAADDVEAAIELAEQAGKADASFSDRLAQLEATQSRLGSVRDNIRSRIVDFIVPICQQAAGVARQLAAKQQEKEEKAAAKEGFPYSPSSQVVGLREQAKRYDTLLGNPRNAVPFFDLNSWLRDLRIS